MTASKITSKGQITIPAVVRAALGVSTGDRIEFIQVDPGRFEMVAATLPISALKGMVKKPAKPVTIDEMNEAIASAGGEGQVIGLDTNVLVRYITQDDPIQAEQANRLLESLATGSEGYVTVIVQDTEIVWKALRNFKMGKADFPDCLIKETSMFAGCSAVVTFDAKAARDIGMSLIGSS